MFLIVYFGRYIYSKKVEFQDKLLTWDNDKAILYKGPGKIQYFSHYFAYAILSLPSSFLNAL